MPTNLPAGRRHGFAPPIPALVAAFAVGALAVLLVQGGPLPELLRELDSRPPAVIVRGGETASLPSDAQSAAVHRYFRLCARPPHRDCIVDGDTFYLGTQSIRIADIDTPETSPPRCDLEARLGAAATRRLQELLNAGPFELVGIGRDEDQYGRKLRNVVRDGGSLGAVLVSEGLARPWTGRRLPWCS